MRVDDRVFRELTLPMLLDKTSTEARCRQWLTELRWPNGVLCDACGHSVYMVKSRPEAFECRHCRHQFSLRSGTPLHGSHLSLRLWLVALYMIATASKGISARQLGRWLGVPYKTAWHLNHRIRSMMLTVPHRGEPLSGEVEIDEQYGGGAQRARNNPSATPEYVQPKSPTGRGQVNTCESFHSLFQRTVQGVYHFVSGKHVDRYLGQSSWYWLRKKAGPISRMADLFAGAPPLPYRDLVHG